MEGLAIESLIAKLPYPMLLVDSNGFVLFANRAATEILGDRATGTLSLELFPDKDLFGLLSAAITSGMNQCALLEWDGQRTYRMHVVPVAEDAVLICLEDTSVRRQLEALKSELTVLLSHDIRNPLGVAIGFSEILIEEPALSDEVRTCIDGIRTSLAKMRNLLDEGLDVLRAPLGPRTDIEHRSSDVAAVVEHVLHDMRPQADAKGQQFVINIAPNLPRALIHPVYLAEILRNLVENAVRYAPEKSTVRVSAETSENGILVKIQDSGPGIPSHSLPRLFERFYRVRSRQTADKEGAGLGLTVVRTIAERHRGRVGVESTEGRGSTFWFWLPAE